MMLHLKITHKMDKDMEHEMELGLYSGWYC